jgi:uncharacterized protein YggE
MSQATTIAAQGEAKADFNLARFSVALDATRDSVPAAKADLKKKVEEFKAALETVKTKLDLEWVKNSVTSSSNVQEQWDYSGKQRQSLGYTATYNYSFQIDDLDKVSKVYDALTSLSQVRVGSPQYSINEKTREKLNKKALKHAFEKVTDRLETECNILGLTPSDFEIYSWETGYSDSRRSDRVAGAAPARAMAFAATASHDEAVGGALSFNEDDSLELVAGQATVHVNLEVGYARKSNTAQVVKAEVVGKGNGTQTSATA